MNLIPPFGESDTYVGRVLPGGLRVLERLGDTSDGPLYRAEYAAGPPVALTLLDALAHPRDPSAASAPSQRLAHQLRRACQICHPNVAGLLDVGETSDGITYAVGEFLTGELLSHVLAAREALPLDEAVGICLQAAAGLQAAHGVGIVHGDVSPRTILVAQSEGGRPSVKLIGFKLDWDAEAGRGNGGGPDNRYSSPERLAGSAPDELGDVFSLGAVLCHLLTGAPPGSRPVRASIPKAVGLVVDRALAPSPDRRYRTVADFADALADAVRTSNRPKPALAAHPRLVGAIGASVLAAGIWLGWNRSRAEGESARTAQEIGMRGREDVGPAQSPNRIAAASKGSLQEAERGDSDAAVALSPFRRAHPWAAQPQGRFYFPSSCPLALQSPELLYFASEAEARATGRSRSTEPGCS